MILFHVLITYGAKPSSSLRDRPEAKPQLVWYRRLCSRYPETETKIVCEYARSIRSLKSLPRLLSFLTSMEQSEIGLIFVDDLSRIFRRTSFFDREKLFQQLAAFGAHIFSCGHNKKLASFTEDEVKALLWLPEQRLISLKQSRVRDTKRARKSSMRSRAKRSVEIGLKIKSLQDELLDIHDKVTLQMIAETANKRGLHTSRGKQWTRQTVGKALEIAIRSVPR